jgi:hypothetical protein
VDPTLVSLLVLLVAFGIAFALPWYLRRPGRALRRRFVALGHLKGKSRKEIVKAAGPASQETPLPDGRTLLQWRATGYHIALVFSKAGRCDGVTHENGRRVTGTRGSEPA